jgi:hypothetical protein
MPIDPPMLRITTAVSLTMLLPFLPIFVEALGIKQQASIVQWSGVAFGRGTYVAPSCDAVALNTSPSCIRSLPILVLRRIG